MTIFIVKKESSLWVYALGTLLFSWPLLHPGFHFYRWDSLLYTLPLQREILNQWLQCQAPAWWEGGLNGTPLLANLNAAVLYPLKLLLLPWNISAGWKVFLFFHLLIALWGTNRLLRRFQLHPVPVLIGSFAYTFGGYARGMWDTHNFLAWAWVPLGLSALVEPGEGKNYGQKGLLLLSICMIILSGDPQTFLGWCGVAILWIALCSKNRWQDSQIFGITLILGVFLTAPQWMPTLHQQALSYRANGLPFEAAVERSFHPLRFLELALPYLFGTHGEWHSPDLFGVGAEKLTPWTASIALGPILWLGLFGLTLTNRVHLRRWILGVLLLGSIFALGRFLPGFEWIQRLPLIRGFRFPEKYLLWVSLALSCGFALGVDALLRREDHMVWKRSCRMVVLIVSAALLSAVCISFVRPELISISAVKTSLQPLAPGLLPLVWLSWGPTSVRRITIILICSTLLGLWACWQQEAPLARIPNPTLHPPPLVNVLLDHPPAQGERFWADPMAGVFPLAEDVSFTPGTGQRSAAMFYNQPWLWGIPTSQGFSPLESQKMRAFRKPLSKLTDQRDVPIQQIVDRLRSSNVTRIYTTRFRWEEFTAAGLNGRVLHTWQGRASQQWILAEVTSSPPAKILSSGPQPPQLLQLWRQKSGQLRLDLSPGDSAQIRLPETYAPGWSSTTEEGVPLPITSDDNGFIVVDTPSNIRQIRLRYHIPGWSLGWAIAGIGACAGIGLLLASNTFKIPSVNHVILRCSHPVVLGLATALLMGALGLSLRSQWAPTYDEGFHLIRGLRFYETGSAEMNYNHPPLQNILSAYALWTHGGPQVRQAIRSATRPHAQTAAVQYAYSRGPAFVQDVKRARWASWWLGLCLTGFTTAWMCRRFGPLTAVVSGGALACSPILLTHMNINTTDAGLTTGLVLGTLWSISALEKKCLWWLGAACGAFLFAAFSKFSGLVGLSLFLVTVVPALACRARRMSILWFIPMILLCFWGICYWMYGSNVSPVVMDRAPDWTLHIPGGGYFAGLLSQQEYVRGGQRAFLAGTLHQQGSWWHLPLIWMIKTPETWTLAGLAGLLLAGRQAKQFLPLLPALVPCTVFLIGLLFMSKLTLGVRHFMPFAVFMILFAAVSLYYIRPNGVRRIIGGFLLLHVILIPYQYGSELPSYTASWTGGRLRGHEWVIDSDYDWGQELNRLEATWATLPNPTRLIYFGFCDPEAIYGIPLASGSIGGYMDYIRQRSSNRIQAWREGPSQLGYPTVASISALRLQPFFIQIPWIEMTSPQDRIGLTFFVYPQKP